MRNLLILATATFLAVLLLSISGAAQYVNLALEKQQMKQRQKEERNALKLQHKYRNESVRGQPIPKAERIRIKHEMERQKRELREQQKDELQDLKDRQRLMKESQNLY